MSCYISDLSGASLSLSDPSLTSGTYTSATINGGTAVLSVPASPSIDNKIFKLVAVVKITDDGVYNNGSGTTLSAVFSIGSTSGTTVLGLNGTGIGLGVYSFETDCIWNSNLQILAAYGAGAISLKSGSGNSNGHIFGSNSGFTSSGISTQAGIQFVFGAFWNSTSNPASATLEEFKLVSI